MQAEAVPQGMHHAPDNHFRLGILATYATHEDGTFRVYALSGECPLDHAVRGISILAHLRGHFGSKSSYLMETSR